MSIEERPAAEPVSREHVRHDRSTGAIAVGIALVAAAVTSVVAVRWFGGLDLVTPVGNKVSATAEAPGTVIVGTQIVAYGPWDTEFAYDVAPVDVRSIIPVVVENSADGDIELLRCGDGPPVAVGAADDVAAACPGATPVVPGSMVLSARPPNEIIAVITTRRPGVVRIEGFRVDYASGIRSTTVDAGINVEVTVGAGDAATPPDDAAPPS
jgi:hypothetical protein